MSTPLIAVVPSYDEKRRVKIPPAYLKSLSECDAIGVVIPYAEDAKTINEYATRFDGFLFSGGVDVDPIYYGEMKAFDSVEIDSDRDRFELLLMEAIYETGKPILGICRGEQMMNVSCGGSLHQHIDGHRQEEEGAIATHKVRIDPTSKLYGIVRKEEIMVNTFHHQAAKSVAPSLRGVAWAEDGTVEAVESDTHPFFLGVQWHPEMLRENESHARALFRAFTEEAKKNAGGK